MLSLLLNISYEPIRLISWTEAVRKWYLGTVEIVEEYNSPLRSQYQEMKIPAVVRLTRAYHNFVYRIPRDHYHIFARDCWRCQYCGERFPSTKLTLDHVIPRSRGGPNSWQNLVAACMACNQAKGSRTPEEAEMPLLARPVKPQWLPWVLVQAIQADEVPQQWAKWISWVKN